MTYVVGVRKDGVASIHADSLLSDELGTPTTTASLKNGVLFEGCIFGVSGDFEPALLFVQNVRKAVRYLDTVAERWAMFEQVCAAWNPNDADFEVLLSTRLTSDPTFYLYRSKTRRLSLGREDFYEIGTGKSPYALTASGFFRSAFKDLSGYSGHAFPYLFSALLRETLAPMNRGVALNAGVGGFFTFVLQDAQEEKRQDAALTVHLTVDEATPSTIMNSERIAFETHHDAGEVMFHWGKPYGLPTRLQMVLQNMTDRTWNSPDMADLDTWMDTVAQQYKTRHPYHFLQVIVLNAPFYVPFTDFAAPDGRYFADMNDYLDESVLGSLMAAYRSDVPPQGWRVWTLPETAGRTWTPP